VASGRRQQQYQQQGQQAQQHVTTRPWQDTTTHMSPHNRPAATQQKHWQHRQHAVKDGMSAQQQKHAQQQVVDCCKGVAADCISLAKDKHLYMYAHCSQKTLNLPVALHG
jgi:hypothetical protein